MNTQKRKLRIALNEAFEKGRAIGRSEELLLDMFPRKKIEQAMRYRLEWLADWWDQVLSDEEDLL
tara:strand:+ start:1165 stop:1359 length:195 start_codon:yes stop_codon:yes gene_type:complete